MRDHENVDEAQRECRLRLAEWQAIANRVRKMVEEHEQFAPEEFKTSILKLLPDYERAANAALAELRVFVRIKSGELRGDEREENT